MANRKPQNSSSNKVGNNKKQVVPAEIAKMSRIARDASRDAVSQTFAKGLNISVYKDGEIIEMDGNRTITKTRKVKVDEKNKPITNIEIIKIEQKTNKRVVILPSKIDKKMATKSLTKSSKTSNVAKPIGR